MAQRLTNERRIFFGEESTEGVDPNASGNPPAANGILVTNLMASPDIAFHARSFVGQNGSVAGKMGAQADPRVSFTVECRGGVTSVVPKLDPLLKVVLGRDAYRVEDTGTGTIQSGDEDTLQLTGVSGTFTPGNAVAVETGQGTNLYEVAWIASYSSGTLELATPLSFAPAANATVKPSVTYRPMNAGHQSLTFNIYLDSTNRLDLVGCKGSMKFDAPAPGAPPTITFNWKAIGWAHNGGGSVSWPAAPTSEITPPTPWKFRIDGEDFGTKFASWSLGQVIARKRSQNSTYGTFAELVTGRSVQGSFQAHDEDETQFDAWRAGTESDVTHQFGRSQYNMVAYRIPKGQRAGVSYGDDNGLTTDWINFQGNITNGEDEVYLAFL